MIPLARIVRHEWRLLAADRSLLLATLLLAALTVYAVSNGSRWVDFQQRTLAQARAEVRAQETALRQGFDTLRADAPPAGPFDRDPRNPAMVSVRMLTPLAALDPLPLAPLAVGQSDLLPYYFRVTTRSQTSFLSDDEIENPVNLLDGRFDLAFVVVTLLPLVILALSYNLLAAERDDGTLALVASQPVPLARLLWGKVLARGVLVLGLVVAVTLAGLALAGVTFGAAGVPARVALWLLAVTLYAAFWFGLAVLVNAGRGSSAANAMVLAGIWLVLVLVTPSVLTVLVRALHPVPSRVALVGAMRTATNEANARGAATLARYLNDHPDMASFQVDAADFWAKSYAVQDAVDRELAPLLARFDAQLAAQQRLVARLGVLSPAIVMQDVLTDLAGTGLPRYRHFREAVTRFHGAWQGYFIPRIIGKRPLVAADLATFPRFTATDEPAATFTGRVLGACAVLALAAFAVWALALRRLARFRVVA